MDILAEHLDQKLREWSPETVEEVRSQVAEIIELADQGLLDIVRSARWSRKSWISSMNPRPGEVWMADLGFAAKFRPVVIVSRQDPDPPRALIVYVPLTTQDRGSP